jgi:hypothetical protein
VQAASLTPEVAQHADIGPAGQPVMPWGAAQLGLDGRAYAPRRTEAPAEGAGYLARSTVGRAEQQLSLDFERARLTALTPKRIDLERRAREATRETTWEWAASRASSTGRPLAPRLAACGTRGLAVRCGCGPRVYWRGCRQWWVCRRCRAARLRPMLPRLTESIVARLEEKQRGGWRAAVRLLTLTIRTSGDPVRDRAVLGEAWRAFYKSMHRWIGRHHYAGVYEVTPGSTGRGHVHMHVAVVWPRWVDYGRVRSLWLAAARGESERIDISTRGGDAKAAAGYLAKYLSKGSERLQPELAGKVVAAFYGVRAITASRGWWVPRCGCSRCGEPVRRCDESSGAFDRVGLPWDVQVFDFTPS